MELPAINLTHEQIAQAIEAGRPKPDATTQTAEEYLRAVAPYLQAHTPAAQRMSAKEWYVKNGPLELFDAMEAFAAHCAAAQPSGEQAGTEQVGITHLTIGQVFDAGDWMNDNFDMGVDENGNFVACHECGATFRTGTIADLSKHLEGCK